MMRKLTPESSLKRLITDWLNAERIPWFRMQSGKIIARHNGRSRAIPFGEPGMADILAAPRIMGRPVYLWIELKAGKGQCTPDQLNFCERVQGFGMNYIVVRSLEALKSWCAEFCDQGAGR